MSPNDNFKRELNNVFDDVSGAPSSQLRDRVRSAVTEAPAQRNTYWIAAVAAMLVTALIVGILYVNNPFRRTGGFAGGPTPTPSSVTSPSPQPSPSPSPSASPTPTATFICTADTVEGGTPKADLTAYVNAERHDTKPEAGYDRIVIQFANGFPVKYTELTPRSSTSFSETSSGQTYKLKGQKGILVRIHGADMHTEYKGKSDFVTGFPTIAEIRVLEDFEGVINIGLGINGDGPACYHAFYLTNPARLVIDVQTAP